MVINICRIIVRQAEKSMSLFLEPCWRLLKKNASTCLTRVDLEGQDRKWRVKILLRFFFFFLFFFSFFFFFFLNYRFIYSCLSDVLTLSYFAFPLFMDNNNAEVLYRADKLTNKSIWHFLLRPRDFPFIILIQIFSPEILVLYNAKHISYMYVCVRVCVCEYMSENLSLSLSLYIYIYIILNFVYTCK